MSDDDAAAGDGGGLSDRAALFVSAVFGLVVATGSVWWVGEQAVWYEAMLRVRPTVAEGGVGADWTYGVAIPALNWMIDLIHLADVVMGVFILLMVFIHWAAFHRLAARMQPPAETAAPESGEAVADGGAAATNDGSTAPDEGGDRR